MGATYVDGTVCNPAPRSHAWTGAFLLDTGAIDVTVGELDLMGALSGSVIGFGDEGAEALLGVTALESAGIKVDPQNQRLKQLPAVRLRGFLGTP